MEKESLLFTPYKLGPVTLRNRTIRSAAFESMGRAYDPTEQLKNYHVSVARGGVGMTTLAYAAVCRSGLSFEKQLWLRPEIVPGLRDITEAVHREGAAASIQIGHCGNMTHYTTAGQIPIGASSGFNLYAYTPVRAMRRDEIRQVAADFGRAVDTAYEAGFDCVEVHAGHGYLISQFLDPLSNVRDDEYGGGFEGRIRFLVETVDAVRSMIPEDMPLLVRVSATDWAAGGWDLDQTVRLAQVLKKHAVDLVDVSTGGIVSGVSVPVNPKYQVPFAQQVRARAQVPVTAVGLITKPKQAERIVEKGEADAVEIGRAALRDPYWPLRAAHKLGLAKNQAPYPMQYVRGAY